jgi:hypothetical protein
MKKSIFVTIAFIAVTSFTNQLFAQESAAKTSGYDLKKNVKCRVITTETGCSLAFEYDVKSPKDVSTGQASGRRGYDYYKAQSDFSVNAADNAVSEVKSPRDAASGLATGKRQHKPVTMTKEYDKSSPKLAESVTSTGTSPDAAAKGSGGGAGKVNVQDLSFSKVNVQDISFTKRCGGKTTKISCDGGECEIPIGDCPNGECSITADWSWGVSQSGSSTAGSAGSGRCSVDFLLEIEDGVCTAMAINEKGLPGEKKPKKTKTSSPK